MSTDLVLTGQRPTYLSAVPASMSGAENPYLTGLRQGALLPTLSIRGKEFLIRKGEEEVSLGYECPVILIGSRPNLSKRFYDSGYKAGERTQPRCASDDGITPYSPSGEGVIASACAGCPNNVFGTGKDQQGNATKGKACQDFRRLVVYPLVSIGGHPLRQAMVLDIPPTSLRAKKGEPPAYSEFARTLGEHGAYVKVTASEPRLQESEVLARQASTWAGQEALLPPYPIQPGAEANTNGAGDAFIGGLVAALLCRTQALSLKQATSFALLAAR